MKVLAFSDVHLGAHGRTDDQEHVLERIAALAIAERVDCCLFAGDLFEGPGVPSSHYMRVRRALCEPLAAAGIPVVATSGNQRHDCAGNQGEDNALAVLHQPGVFDVYTRPGLHLVTQPRWSDQEIVAACVPWASVNRLRAMLDGTEDTDALAAQLVIRIMEQLRAEAECDYPGVPCMCLTHFATTGWRTPTGLPTDEIRDVLLPLDELERIGFDAILAGHIHCPGVISDPGGPIISLGSPGCLNHGEAEVAHGAWILEDGIARFVPIDGRAFLTIEYDLAGNPEAAVEELPQVAAEVVERVPTAGTDLAPILRLRYKATADQDRRIDRAALKAALLAAGAHEVTIEATVERETRARVAEMSAHLSPLDALDLWIGAENGRAGDKADALRTWTREALDVIA